MNFVKSCQIAVAVAAISVGTLGGSWAEDLKPFAPKEGQFKVNVCCEMIKKNVQDGVIGYRTDNEPSAANNGYAVLVMTGKMKYSRYNTYKFLVSQKIFVGKTNLKETTLAGFPALNVEGMTEKGMPCNGKIVTTPSTTYVVLGAGYETNGTRDFINSFQLKSVAQVSSSGKCCSNEKKAECSGECSK
jgi:hypothetical protein